MGQEFRELLDSADGHASIHQHYKNYNLLISKYNVISESSQVSQVYL